MQDVEVHPAHLHHPGPRKFAGPVVLIDIAPHRQDRGDFFQGRQDLRAADIPGMDDEFHALQGRDRLGPQQAVGIGNDADEVFSHASQFDLSETVLGAGRI